MGQLNELQIKAAEPRDKEYMLSDGEGLYLRVRTNGKVWIYRYKQSGRQAKLSVGSYPTVSLSVARRKARDEAQKRADGIDPRDGRWIAERHPDQLPAKYGCSSWRQVVHESRLFELRYREVDGQRAAWYRAKQDSAHCR